MRAAPLRVVIADDERPARRFLADVIARCADVAVVAEAASGGESVRLIERVEATVERARSRLVRSAPATGRDSALDAPAATLARAERQPYLDRIPVKRRDDVVLVPVRQVACIVAERELLHLTTIANERHTIAYRLHAL